jgi:hypothetical protein
MTLVWITMVSSAPNDKTAETKVAEFWSFQRKRISRLW